MGDLERGGQRGWWSGTPAQYAALFKAAYPAVKSADPSATVILGGLTGNDGPYLQPALRGRRRRAPSTSVGVHTDTACNITSPYIFEYNPGTHTINQYFFLGFISIHAVMVAAGDARQADLHDRARLVLDQRRVPDRPLGRAEGSPASTEPTQATYLQQAYHCLAQPQYSYVKAAMWFELFDDGASTDPLDNFGLLEPRLLAKPAFAAFEQESLHGDQLSRPVRRLRAARDQNPPPELAAPPTADPCTSRSRLEPDRTACARSPSSSATTARFHFVTQAASPRRSASHWPGRRRRRSSPAPTRSR